MSKSSDIRRQLESELPEAEVEETMRVAERLEAERPVPTARFRAELRSRLLGSLGTAGWRPARLRLTICAYVASGVALLGVAGLGVAGVGPLSHDSSERVAYESPTR